MTRTNQANEQRLRFSRRCPTAHVPIEYPPVPLLLGFEFAEDTGRCQTMLSLVTVPFAASRSACMFLFCCRMPWPQSV